MNRFLHASFFVLLSVAGALLGATSANAASEYDNTIRNTPNATLISGDTTLYVDAGISSEYSWSNILLGNTSYSSNLTIDEKNSLNTALANGSYLVTVEEYTPDITFARQTLTIRVYNSVATTTYGFSTLYGCQTVLSQFSGTSYTDYNIILNNNNTVSIFRTTPGIWSSGGIVSPDCSTEGASYFIYQFPSYATVLYPDDYEGETPQPEPNTDPSNSSPDVQINSGNSIFFEAIDLRFNTIDPNQWVCSDLLAPVWHYEIWEGQDPDTDVLYSSGSLSSTGKLKITLKPELDWAIVSWYSCAEEPIFTASNFTYFSTGVSTYSQHKPEWYILEAINWKATIQDKNFNTFDGNPFTCEGGFVPVLHYQIWRVAPEENILITSGIQSASAQIIYQFDTGDSARTYFVSGYYNCGTNDPNQFDSSDPSTLEFEITGNGVLNMNLLESCLQEAFPFVNVPGCIANISVVVNLLSFGSIVFSNDWFTPIGGLASSGSTMSLTDSCYSLVVIDDWLNLPDDYQACPQIPSYVRNVVTPFVTFALGLLTITFLARNKGSEW